MKTDEEVLKEIGVKLKELRIKNGYKSYESFAIDNNLSRMQYWRMEKGITNVTIKSLKRILDIHNVSINDFFNSDN